MAGNLKKSYQDATDPVTFRVDREDSQVPISAYMKEKYHPVTDAFVTDWWGLYDASGNVVAFDADIGSAIIEGTAEFDPWNRETIRTDALGNAVTNVYDELGRLMESSGAVYPVAYGYDASSRMTSLSTQYGQDASTSKTSWIHDPRTGLATAKEYDDETQIAYTHTPDGRPLRTTWARGAWREHEYDERELLTGKTYSEARLNDRHAYDAFGHVVASSNAIARYVYANSALGVATNESVFIGAEGIALSRSLDDRQRLSKLEAGHSASAVFYAYDSENRLDTVSNEVFTVSYQYTSDGLDAGSTIILTNGITLIRAVDRDPFRRELITLVSNTVNAAATSAYDYEYDYLGRATDRNDDAFGYNARSEVTAANIASNEYGYAYDDTGNHLFNTVNTGTNTYEVNALNQYTNINYFAGSTQPVYDLDGNMVSNGVWTYTWDAANQLTAAYSNSVCVVSNAYDHMSRRVLKISHGGTETRRFIYDGWNLVQEAVTSASGTTTNFFVWGKDLSGSLQGAGGVGGLIAVKQGNAWYFPFYDNNGNIMAYADESGTLVVEYTFDAFGDTLVQSGSMADAFRFRFSTKYYDAETELYYYGYRFYSPDIHRWINRDPIEEFGGIGLYTYTQNNALRSFDLLGLKTKVQLYLTFDDGPVYGTDDVLNNLKASNVKASFFVNGMNLDPVEFGAKRVAWNINQLKRIISEGHLLGNHGYSHKFNYDDPSFMENDFSKNIQVIRDALGTSCPNTLSEYARLPGGNAWRVNEILSDDEVRKKDTKSTADMLNQGGYQIFGWDIEWRQTGTDDLRQTPSEMSEEVFAAFKNQKTRKPCKMIMLAHDRQFKSSKGNGMQLSAFINILKSSSDYDVAFGLLSNY